MHTHKGHSLNKVNIDYGVRNNQHYLQLHIKGFIPFPRILV